jgi:hypothetical protein
VATKGFVPSPFERLAIPSATRALSAVMEAPVSPNSVSFRERSERDLAPWLFMPGIARGCR